MKPLKNLIENWWIYALMIALGSPIGNAVPPEKMLQALIVIGTVILTALIATLLVPFAAFSRNEGWQKFAVQYGAVPTFGTYGVLLFRWAGVWAMLLVLPPLLVHAGYWQSSMHSRQYRLELFKLGFSHRMPYVTKLVVVLSAQRMQHMADEMICALFSGERVDLEPARNALPKKWEHLLLCAGEEEATENRQARLNIAKN